MEESPRLQIRDELLGLVAPGTGVIYLLRWYWWRVNAWSEIVAMTAAFSISVFFFLGNVKARACYLLAHEFVRHAAEGASFVGISSVNAEQSEPDHLAYDAACAALGGIIRSFAVHHAPRYRFNAVAPGLVATRLTREVADEPRLREHACANIPLARIGSPDDCAGAVLFLLSADAAYVTGETLFVDGGIRANQMSRLRVDAAAGPPA